MMLLTLEITVFKMLLLQFCFQTLLLIHIFLKLLDCLCKTLLVSLLGFCVFFNLLSSCRHLPLKLFTLILTIPDESLVLMQILLQVVKDLKFLIECN